MQLTDQQSSATSMTSSFQNLHHDDSDFIAKFQSAINNSGLIFTDSIVADGQLHRAHIEGDSSNKKNGWYVLYAEPIPAGAFGSWKHDVKESWCYKQSSQLTPIEQQLVKERVLDATKKRDTAKLHAATNAKLKAKKIIDNATEAALDHPYLVKKNIKPLGIKQSKGRLVIPMLDMENCIHSLQFISLDGNKHFLADGVIAKHFLKIGENSDTIYLCEGYATGVTIHEATGCIVIVAFTANNLMSVAEIILRHYLRKKIIVCADNDQWTKNNPGLTKARSTAKKIGAFIVSPSFDGLDTSNKPTDFNDLMQLVGMDEVKRQLNNPSQFDCSSEVLSEDKSQRRPSQATMIMSLVENVEFFHDKQRQAYGTFKQQNHFETWLIDSQTFQDWLAHNYYMTYKKVASKNSLKDVLEILRAKAVFEGKCHEVFSRVGLLNDKIYINLANENWELIEISSSGWQVRLCQDIKFKGSRTMRTLPTPISGGDINLLWQYINIPDNAKILVIGWLLECFMPNTNFPILVLTGQQGSAKSTTQSVLRDLIDPSISNLRGAPKKSDDIYVAAINNWLVSFNNVSNLTTQNQDDLCCLSTGGGLGTRRFFTTCEEEVVEIKRPVILNGINDVITAQDLISRCIVIDLPPIDKNSRKTESEIMQNFANDYSFILGALLDMLAEVLKELPNVKLNQMPRMADFLKLGAALEKVMNFPKNSFLNAYEENQKQSTVMAIEHSPAIVVLIQCMNGKNYFEGTYKDLFNLLNANTSSQASGWPTSEAGLARLLKRQAPALRVIGLQINFSERKRDGYHIEIIRIDEDSNNIEKNKCATFTKYIMNRPTS